MSNVRHPAVAGLFYDADPVRLNRTVSELLLKSRGKRPDGRIVGLIAPHAGYMYSGFTAAKGYALLEGLKFDTVVIVGPSHREFFNGISIYPGEGFLTPLGEVAIDHEIRDALVRLSSSIRSSESGHRAEHSVEVQLPFLQKVLGLFSFVPIVMGNQTRLLCDTLAEALARTLQGRNVLLVASSDLSHYHSYNIALSLDRQILEDVEAFDENSLMMKLEQQRVEACGGGPMVAVMKAVKKLGADTSDVIFYCNSGDVTGEKDAVVGYLSAAFLQTN